jgi:hypothetical protein
VKISITIKLDGDGEPIATAEVLDLTASEVFTPPLQALPPPRRWPRPNLIDGAAIAGALLLAALLLSGCASTQLGCFGYSDLGLNRQLECGVKIPTVVPTR